LKLPKLLVLSTIKDVSVLYFKSLDHSSEAPPHFFILIPLNQVTCFVVSVITSNIDGRWAFYRYNEKAKKSLVAVDNNVFAFLKSQSLIDCNQSKLLTVEELVAVIDPDGPFDIKTRELPSYLKEEIIAAVLRSPLIERYIKDLVKKNYRGKRGA